MIEDCFAYQHDGRPCPKCVNAGLLALSRVMVWVRMELEAQHLFALFVAVDHSPEFAGLVARAVAFTDVCRGMSGRLRLTYPEGS